MKKQSKGKVITKKINSIDDFFALGKFNIIPNRRMSVSDQDSEKITLRCYSSDKSKQDLYFLDKAMIIIGESLMKDFGWNHKTKVDVFQDEKKQIILVKSSGVSGYLLTKRNGKNSGIICCKLIKPISDKNPKASVIVDHLVAKDGAVWFSF